MAFLMIECHPMASGAAGVMSFKVLGIARTAILTKEL